MTLLTSFIVRELKSTDTEALLAFEAENREWFEAHIDPREPSFYTAQGVAEHIESFLANFDVGNWHPFVIEDARGRIVGRANLKNINASKRCAEVGYRIDQGTCGQGLATLALRHLIQQAQTRWQLTQLVAYAFEENAGSHKVLERCGFLLEPPASYSKPGDERRFVLAL